MALAQTEAPIRRRRARRLSGRATSYAVLAVGLAIWLVPFVWMVLGSVKTQGEILRRPPTWWPQAPTGENYAQWFGPLDFWHFFGNSLIVALVTLQVKSL